MSNPSLLRPGALQGDLNADGHPDSILVALDPKGMPGCQAFLIAQLGGSRKAVPVSQWEPGSVLAAPHLRSVAQIDAAPGDEVVVDVVAGASTQFEAVYGLAGGELASIGLKGVAFNGLFAYGGSVGHLDGEACTRKHLVVVSSAAVKGASGTRYKVIRRFFRPRIGVLRYLPKRTQRKIRPAASLGRLREFSGAPFADCAPL